MDARIIWTERASSDIEAIVRYIARRNPDAASRIDPTLVFDAGRDYVFAVAAVAHLLRASACFRLVVSVVAMETGRPSWRRLSSAAAMNA